MKFETPAENFMFKVTERKLLKRVHFNRTLGYNRVVYDSMELHHIDFGGHASPGYNYVIRWTTV